MGKVVLAAPFAAQQHGHQSVSCFVVGNEFGHVLMTNDDWEVGASRRGIHQGIQGAH